MKSKLYKTENYDVQAYLDGVDVSILPNDQTLEEAVQSVAKKHLILLPIDTNDVSCNGDVVCLKTRSELPKFNKERVNVTLGKGFYDKNLEEKAIGKKIGSYFTLQIQDKDVEVEILEIKRKQVSEVTDSMIQQEGIENVNTIEEYKAHVLKEREVEVYGQILSMMVDQFSQSIQLEIDEEDFKIMANQEIEFMRNVFKEEGKDLDNMSPSELEENLGVPSLQQLAANYHEWHEKKLRYCYVICDILNLSLEEFDPVADKMNYIHLFYKMLDYVKEELKERVNHG